MGVPALLRPNSVLDSVFASRRLAAIVALAINFTAVPSGEPKREAQTREIKR